MFWLFHSLHERAIPRSETGIRGLDDSPWHGSKWGRWFDRIPATSLRGIEVLAFSFDTDYFDNNLRPILTIIYVIRETEKVMILQFVEILQFSKVLISLV